MVNPIIQNSQSPLKILVLSRFADRRGGADVYTEGLAIGLSNRGHEVQLMCHAASPAVNANCNVSLFPDNDSSQLRIVWRFGAWFYQRHCRRYLKSQGNLKPDVIISSLTLSSGDIKNQFPGVPWIYLPHSRIAPIEATAQISESFLHRRFSSRIYSRWERWSLLNAATTVRFTSDNEQILRDYYRLPSDAAFEIIPAPINGSRIDVKANLGDPLRLVAVGRLVESKNFAKLLRILASLKKQCWHLTIAGDGPQKSQLESLAVELKISNQVTFLGFCENVEDVYRSADLHVFPSIRESLGLVILESMAFGIPTIAFLPDGKKIQTASHELIEHRKDGMLARDEDDFRDLLLDCLENPQPLLEMGEKARQKAISNHDWTVVVAAWESVLTRVIDAN